MQPSHFVRASATVFSAFLCGVMACQPARVPQSSTQPETATSANRASVPESSPNLARFDSRLSGYHYPFPVETFAFESQQTSLEMAYMDVHPPAANGRTVLLLHGKNFSRAYWERTAKDLVRQGFRVVMPDQIGFGKSSKPVGFQYSLAAMAEHTHALLRTLGIEHTAVVGHSMGGMLAVRFALMYPEATNRLALVNPIGLEDWQRTVKYASVDALHQQALEQTPEKVRTYMQNNYFHGTWKPEYEPLTEIQAAWSMSAERSQLSWISALTSEMIFTQPVVHELVDLRTPTLLIIGTVDRTAIGKERAPEAVKQTLGQYQELGKRAAAAIPNAQLVELDGVGHVPQVEAYDRYITALLAFLTASL